jgi:hypothetical protein
MEKFYERTFVCHDCKVNLFIENVSFNKKGEVKFYLNCNCCMRYFYITFKIEELMMDCYLMDRNLEVFDGGVCNGTKTQ